jgi:prefoldin subunit 5
MGYQPRIKSRRDGMHEYRKPLRERKKEKKRSRHSGLIMEERHVVTEREISEGTLKRLHTLGNQKFASSPFSEHYDRWLSTVEAVLAEFEAHPSIGVDEQFERECQEALATIKRQLEQRRRREAAVEQELKNLAFSKSQLQQINAQYATLASGISGNKSRVIKRLNNEIDLLKREQEKVIQMKTGFFRGISKKEREQKEIGVAEQISSKQTDLELAMLDFSAKRKALREQFDKKLEPVQEQIKKIQKTIRDLETDGSLEERWFACEALIDAVNSFLQRKAVQPR